MNDIRPFRGLRFDERVVGPVGQVVCPPYDVISAEEQISLYGRNPHNVVRLELGLEFPEDDASSNRYTRAAATLQRWLAERALREEAEPALYLYEQQFSYEGETLVRRGLLAALRLAPWEEGVVLPHEETMAGPKADRLELMRATACDLSPIFLLFDDPSGTLSQMMAEAARHPADVTADTGDGQLHRLWVLPAAGHRDLLAALQKPQLYMADGHHRYETEMAYRDERRRAEGANPPAPFPTGEGGEDSPPLVGEGAGERSVEAPYDFGMMLLVDALDPGLVVLPTHRMVRGVEPGVLAVLDAGLSADFLVERVATEGLDAAGVAGALLRRMRELGDRGAALGIYRPGVEAAVLTPRPGVQDRLMPREAPLASDVQRRPFLDVDLLHDGLLMPLLGIGPEQLRAGAHVLYTRDAAEAVAVVEKGSAQVAFLLNPTRVEQVMETARAGGKMPQKSTYFYPKPVTGSVIYRL